MEIDDAARTLRDQPNAPPPSPPPQHAPPPPISTVNTYSDSDEEDKDEEKDDAELHRKKASPPPVSMTSPRPVNPVTVAKTWDEFTENLAIILRNIGETKVEWTANWGTMYRQIFTLKTITRDAPQTREPLYAQFEQQVIFHVEEQLTQLLELSNDSYVFLRSYLGKWCGYTIAIKYIHDIFGMHYFWVKNEELPDIFMYGLRVWREYMFDKLASHLTRATLSLLTLIRDNADSLSSHQIRDVNIQFFPSLIRNQVVLAPEVGAPHKLFTTSFLEPFIDNMRQYYNKEALTLIEDGSATKIARFMLKAETRIEEEFKRLKLFASSPSVDQDSAFPDLYHALLHSCWFVCESMNQVEDTFSSALTMLTTKVRETLYDVFVTANSNVLIAACSSMFNDGKWEDLHRMLRLLTLTNSSSLLEAKMRDHIAEMGIAIVDEFEANAKKDVCEYVDKIYVLMIHYRNMAHTFPHHKFGQIIDQAFEAILNKSKNCCRYLAQYVDYMIKASVKKSADLHIEQALEKIIDMLKYINDKDIFMVYYVHYLAKRLLDPEIRSIDNDNERLMIGKIKLNHGKSFTLKMEQMLKDVTLSSDIGYNFGTWIKQEKGSTSGPELLPIIMETGAWPSSVLRDPGGGGECFLPLEVENTWFAFKAYYLSLYSGRRLVFTPHLGSAEISLYSCGKSFTATVSSFAMCVLLLFEHTNTLSFEDIKSMTNIPAKALIFALQALSAPISLPAKKANGKKVRGPQLLQISPGNPNTNTNNNNNNNNNTTTTTTTTTTSTTNPTTNPTTNNEITETCIVNLNVKFGEKCPVKRFKVTNVNTSYAQGVATNSELEDGQKKKREWQVDCIVVRVMKTRRKLGHNALIQEVIAQSANQFTPTVQLIKLRLQALIDREFIRRDHNDHSTYVYLE